MVLSIGMIVKNEEKYLERCLTALKPILESIDSELIIADTGSTDNTVEIAKKFTDNVFHFEWINDFAAARNSTLERARGEWYMFIDADEILQDCADLIRFFKSGEYKKFGSASFQVRSYIDTCKLKEYRDSRALRLSLKRDDVKFVNSVHEVLEPFLMPYKDLDLIADHYGYLFYDNGEPNDFAKQKGERNLRMMTEELAEQEADGNIRPAIYNQIADCYGSMGMHDKALEYVDKGFENIDPDKITIIMYYNHKLSLLMGFKRYVEAIRLSEQYFSKENSARKTQLASDCYVYAVRGMAYYNLGDYSLVIQSFAMCFELYSAYLSGQLVTEDLLLAQFRVTLSSIKTYYELFYKCCISENSFDLVNRANRVFPLSECLSDHDYMLTHLLLRVEIMEQTGYSKLADLYYKLDDYNRKAFIRIMRWRFFNTDKHEMIARKLGDIVKGDQHLEDTLEIFSRYYIKNNLTLEKIGEYIAKYSASENEDIWCVMMLAGYDITPYITAPDFSTENCTRMVYVNYVPGAAELFASYDINAISKEGLKKAASVYGWAMIGASNNDLDTSRLFEKYGQIGLRWYNEFPDAETIHGDIRAAMMVSSIVAARRNGDYKRCVSEMRDLAVACPPFAPIINEYGEEIRNEMNTAVPTVNPEFAQLAAQVKANIRTMIDEGNLTDAENTLIELEQLCQFDPEIDMLKDEIYKIKTGGFRQ